MRHKVCYSVFSEGIKGGNHMSKINESAHGLENAIRESKEFIELKTAFDTVMNDPESKEMFDNFRNIQLDLQEKQIQGLDITEEEIEEAQKIVGQVQQHEDISKLMNAEQVLNEVINEVSRIITTPLEELYGNPLSS